MDVEKRMSLSLDDIIKKKGKGATKGAPTAAKTKTQGKSKSKASLPTGKRGKVAAKGRGKANGRLKSRQMLGVAGRGKAAKVQKPGWRVKLQVSKPAGGKPGQQSRPAGIRKSGNPKRVVSVPTARDFQVTIKNDRAAQQQRQQYTTVPRSGAVYQAPLGGGQAQQQYMPQQLVQAAHGYGPRNLVPREDLSIAALSRMSASRTAGPALDFGISRRILGASLSSAMAPTEPQRRQLQYVDYDNSRTALRMDYGR